MAQYDGEFDAAGRPHGRGTLFQSDGTVFRGRFEHGSRHGRGTLLAPDGAVVSGVWRADALEGDARLMWLTVVGRALVVPFMLYLVLGLGAPTSVLRQASGK